jgi:ankyrin repeat protein
VKKFIDEAMVGHQCMWGVHSFIHKADAKPFMDWFNMPENQGFQPYNCVPLFAIVKDLVIYHYEIAWDMQQHKTEYSVDDMNAQLIRTKELQKYYEQLSGETFLFNVLCTRDTDICNQRRAGSVGVNHTHPVELDEPSFQKPTFEDLIRLRQQCIELGIKPQIGVETDIGKRCKIYQERMLEHFDRLKKAAAAKIINEARPTQHKKAKGDIQRTSAEMSKLQVWEACNTCSLPQIESLMKKGVNLNTESVRGQSPLITMALCGAQTELFVRAIRAGADTDYVNRYGFTALMAACRRRDAAAIHALLKNGASALTCDPVRKQAAIHHCAYFGLETETQILYDYVKEGAGDSLKVLNFLNARDKAGDTGLIIAARRRNNLMCKFLLSLGADPGARNLAGM